MTEEKKELGLGGGGYKPEFKVAENSGFVGGRDMVDDVEVSDPRQNLDNYTVNMEQMKKVVKEYKKLKKYTKSNLYQIQKLSGQETIIDKLTREFNENPEL
jgi:hypothetical protein